MMKTIELAKILNTDTEATGRGLFVLLNLGIIESLANGGISPLDATRLFYHADNCQFVKEKLRDKTADEIMGRGVQLQDLFDALPTKEAQQEFQRELAAIRSLCLQLLDQHELVA
ncbi:MAG TPA: hypothetical protein VMJ32_16590 [Pirellulales bacterium]|nr:hypothetical protein [Pirellulales bacterium]